MILSKHMCIRKILSLYSYATNEDKEGSLYDSYSRILTKKIDYDVLWDKFSRNFPKYPPSGEELQELAKTCYKEDFKECGTTYLHVKVFDPRYRSERNIDCFPKGTSDEAIIRTYKKKFNCTGWKIISKVEG